MYRVSFFLLLCFLLISCHHEFESNNQTFEIIIVAGQSNTSGGTGLDFELDKPNPNIFQLGRYSIYNHVVLKAEEPLQHHTPSPNSIGFALTFAKLYNSYKNKENPILIIPCGFEGTSLLNHWQPNGFLYQDLIERTRFVLKKFPNSKITALLWHQGESDIGRSNHKERLDRFILKTRTDLENDFPFVLGGMVPYWTLKSSARIEMQNILKNTPFRVHNTAYANPDVPFPIEKKDNSFNAIHYDAKGQRELGKRYFEEFVKLLQKNKSENI